MSRREQIRAVFAILSILILDLLAYYLALSLAYFLRVGLNQIVSIHFGMPFSFYSRMYWIPLIFMVAYAFEQLYGKRAPYWDEVGRMLKANLIAIGSVFAILALLKVADRFSRLFLLLLGLMVCLIQPVIRLWGKRLLHSLKIWCEPVVIFGTGTLGKSIADAFASDPYLGYRVTGFVSLKPGKSVVETSKRRQFPILCTFNEVVDQGSLANATRFVFAEETLANGEATRYLNEVIRHFRKVLVVPSSLQIPVLNTEPLHLFREQMMVFRINNNLLNPVSRFLKRTFDLASAFLSLPFLLPAVLVIALLIRLESRGTAFYSQDRIGFKGRIFRFYKFRTMYVNNEEILEQHLASNPEIREEWEQFKKLRGKDPRVTRIGRFLRKTSLDELPQIWNVFRGNMSLVGPRPYLPREQEEMKEEFSMIIAAKPGLTGLWQISGRNELAFQDRLKMDQWYVANWTLWLDVEILIKTIAVVLKREGAY